MYTYKYRHLKKKLKKCTNILCFLCYYKLEKVFYSLYKSVCIYKMIYKSNM